MQVLQLNSGKITSIDIDIEPVSIDPTFTYTGENLSRIDYSDLSYKLFYYDINDNLIETRLYKNNTILQKLYSYDSLGNLSSIVQNYI